MKIIFQYKISILKKKQYYRKLALLVVDTKIQFPISMQLPQKKQEVSDNLGVCVQIE